MIRFFCILALLCGFPIGTAAVFDHFMPVAPECPCCAPSVPQTVASGVVAPSVEIRTEDCQGAGTVVLWRGKRLVVGAAHVTPKVGAVVTVRKECEGTEGNVQEFEAKVIFAGDPEATKGVDVAILEPDPLCDFPATPLDDSVKLVRGEDAWFCGTAGGVHGLLVKSVVNRPEYRTGFHTWLLVNGEAWFGHSGSGVFVKRDGKFRLVGVISRPLWGGEGMCRAPTECEPLSAILKALNSLEKK